MSPLLSGLFCRSFKLGFFARIGDLERIGPIVLPSSFSGWFALTLQSSCLGSQNPKLELCLGTSLVLLIVGRHDVKGKVQTEVSCYLQLDGIGWDLKVGKTYNMVSRYNTECGKWDLRKSRFAVQSLRTGYILELRRLLNLYLWMERIIKPWI